MITGNEPVNVIYDEPNVGIEYTGLTIRQHFAATAPKIPNWFVFNDDENKPIPPDESNLSGEDARIVRSWLRDPCYDLEAHLQWFQQAHDKYWDAKVIFEKELLEKRYFAWRTYYAGRLIAELNKPVKP